jgi:hypothetical protein
MTLLSSDGTASGGPVQLPLTRLSMQANGNKCVLSDGELKVLRRLLNQTRRQPCCMFVKYELIDSTSQAQEVASGETFVLPDKILSDARKKSTHQKRTAACCARA